MKLSSLTGKLIDNWFIIIRILLSQAAIRFFSCCSLLQLQRSCLTLKDEKLMKKKKEKRKKKKEKEKKRKIKQNKTKKNKTKTNKNNRIAN